MELTLRLARLWWAGFKVLCRWYAFEIVLGVLCLPLAGILMGIAYLVPDSPYTVLLVLAALLTQPIPFYLTSRYLHLLGDKQPPSGTAESAGAAGAQRDYGLRIKIALSVAGVFVGAILLTPTPDPISGLVLGAVGAILCGGSLLILSRMRFVKSASKPTQTLICVLVCLLSLLAMYSWLATNRIIHLHSEITNSSSSAPEVSSSQL